MNSNIFTVDFVSSVESILSSRCVAGNSMPVKELCDLLEVPDDEMAGAVRCLVRTLPEYELRKGVGVIRKGETAHKPAEFPPGFVDSVRNALAILSGEKEGVTRKTLAEAIGQPGSTTEAAITRAYNEGHLPGYKSKKGIKGGFVKDAPAASESN